MNSGILRKSETPNLCWMKRSERRMLASKYEAKLISGQHDILNYDSYYGRLDKQ